MFHGTANSMSYRCVSMQIYVDCHSNIKAKLSNTCAISFFDKSPLKPKIGSITKLHPCM